MTTSGTRSSRQKDRSQKLERCPERQTSSGRCKAVLAWGLFALTLGAAAWSANDAPQGTVSLWTGDDEWVRIEPQDKAATVPNDQPVSLDGATVARSLSALRIRIVDPDTGTEVQHTAFTADEVGRIASYVTSGLAKAGPRQDVTFSTIGSHSRGVGSSIKDPTVNAGRIFYQGGKLNVIFGELQSNYRKKNIYGQREDFTPRRQGTREKASKQKVALTLVPGVALQSTPGGVRDDWVTIDLAVAGAQTVATSPAAAATAAQAPSASPAPQPAPPPAATGAAATVAPAAAGAAPAPAPVAAPTAPAADSKTADLERRLRALKEMKDKGLITEEAYNAKMKELLSEL